MDRETFAAGPDFIVNERIGQRHRFLNLPLSAVRAVAQSVLSLGQGKQLNFAEKAALL